jgi:predicted N-acetyltransferase YhbS
MSSTDSIIRRADRRDIAAIRAMQERAMWALGGAFYTPAEIMAFLTTVTTMDDSVVEEGHYFVAEAFDGTILASGGWSQTVPGYAANSNAAAQPRDVATVRSVFVDASMCRRGLATRLMRRTEDDAAQEGIGRLRLTATLSGVPLYDALGYGRVRDLDLHLAGVRFACVEMQKPLAASTAA